MAQPLQMMYAGVGASMTIVAVLMISNIGVSYFAKGQTVTGFIDDKIGSKVKEML